MNAPSIQDSPSRPASRRRRNLAIGAIVVLLVAGEVAYQSYRGRRACIVVTNQAPEPVEGLRFVCGPSSTTVARLNSGESTKVYMAGRGGQTLVLSYRQKGNSLQGFQIAGFDLADMSRTGSRLVINIRVNEFERFQEEDDPSGLGALATRGLRWLLESVESP